MSIMTDLSKAYIGPEVWALAVALGHLLRAYEATGNVRTLLLITECRLQLLAYLSARRVA